MNTPRPHTLAAAAAALTAGLLAGGCGGGERVVEAEAAASTTTAPSTIVTTTTTPPATSTTAPDSAAPAPPAATRTTAAAAGTAPAAVFVTMSGRGEEVLQPVELHAGRWTVTLTADSKQPIRFLSLWVFEPGIPGGGIPRGHYGGHYPLLRETPDGTSYEASAEFTTGYELSHAVRPGRVQFDVDALEGVSWTLAVAANAAPDSTAVPTPPVTDDPAASAASLLAAAAAGDAEAAAVAAYDLGGAVAVLMGYLDGLISSWTDRSCHDCPPPTEEQIAGEQAAAAEFQPQEVCSAAGFGLLTASSELPEWVDTPDERSGWVAGTSGAVIFALRPGDCPPSEALAAEGLAGALTAQEWQTVDAAHTKGWAATLFLDGSWDEGRSWRDCSSCSARLAWRLDDDSQRAPLPLHRTRP